MLSNKEWLAFFHNIKNKPGLLDLFMTYLSADNFVKSSLLPTLANNENTIFEISSSVTNVFERNHKENDTRIIYHALQQKTDVAICLKDMDVLVLMVFAYALTKINEMQVIEIESRICINIRKIIEYPTTDVATKLPQINAVTGCDTTSFLHGVSKIKVFKSVSMDKKNPDF